MNFEIEHKYLVKDSSYKDLATQTVKITQGYLNKQPERTVRVRIANHEAFLTIKGKNEGDTRIEMEYPIPLNDAHVLLGMCEKPIIRKIRYIIYYKGNKWEVDEFLSTPDPLTVAEIELSHSGFHYELPPFIGENVTGNPKYYNSNL